jgi:hypothetical protein
MEQRAADEKVDRIYRESSHCTALLEMVDNQHNGGFAVPDGETGAGSTSLHARRLCRLFPIHPRSRSCCELPHLQQTPHLGNLSDGGDALQFKSTVTNQSDGGSLIFVVSAVEPALLA